MLCNIHIWIDIIMSSQVVDYDLWEVDELYGV